MAFHHISVMPEEVIDGLAIRPDGIYVDCTLGGAGHAHRIAERLSAAGRLIGIDQDEAAIEAARARLADVSCRVDIVHDNFQNLDAILERTDAPRVDGVLFDLGVSSPQLDEADRGFSYMTDAPLDMRMDRGDAVTAADIVNTWSYADLKRILYDFGEERYAPRIAEAIVKYREEKPLETTLELVDVIKGAMPAAALREKQHPAKRSFQALRIAVNGELDALSQVLSTAGDRLRPGGRLCVVSFHSLEDRIVKNAITSRENGCTCPRDFPVCVCGFVQTMKTVTKPITASEEELNDNPRARSARLRVAERI